MRDLSAHWMDGTFPKPDERYPRPWLLTHGGSPVAVWTNGFALLWGEVGEPAVEPRDGRDEEFLGRVRAMIGVERRTLATMPRADAIALLRDAPAAVCGSCAGQKIVKCSECFLGVSRGSCDKCDHDCSATCENCEGKGRLECWTCKGRGVADGAGRWVRVGAAVLDAWRALPVIERLDGETLTIALPADADLATLAREPVYFLGDMRGAVVIPVHAEAPVALVLVPEAT